MMFRLALLSFCLALPIAHSEVLFEGFYRIEKAGKHIGYAIQRVSRDPKAKTKTLITYVMQESDGQDSYEYIKSVANESNLAPIESFYGGNSIGKDYRTKFQKGTSVVEIHHPKSRNVLAREQFETVRTPLQGSFLFYLADLKKLAIKKNYYCNFFAERASRPAYAQLSLEGTTKIASSVVQQVVIDMLGQPTENFLTENGDPLGSRAPGQDVVAYWVKDKKSAIGTFEYPSNAFISLFGDLPEGKKNPWYSLADFDSLKVISSFRKSIGTRKLAAKERRKISYPLPTRI